MPEAFSPIVRPAPTEFAKRQGAEVKNFPGLTTAWTNVFETLETGSQAGIFKRSSDEWQKDPGLAADTVQKPQLAQALADQGQRTEKSVAILITFNEAENTKVINIDPTTGKLTENQTPEAQRLISEAAAVYPNAIEGLKLIITATDGKTDTESQALGTRAKAALAEIESNIEVVAHLIDGTTRNISYPDWNRFLDDNAAFKLWTSENPTITEDRDASGKVIVTLEDKFKKLPTVTRLAYRISARKNLDKQYKKVDYELVYAPDEIPPVMEAEKRTENILEAIRVIEKAHFEKAHQFEGEKAGNRAQYDPDLTELVYWGDYLDKVKRGTIKVADKAKTEESLTALLTRASRYYLFRHTDMQDPNVVNLVAGNETYYNRDLRRNDPTLSLVINQCERLGMKLDMLGIVKHEGKYITTNEPEVNIARILRYTRILQPAISADVGRIPGDKGSFVEDILTRSTNEINNLNGTEAAFLSTINHNDQLKAFHDAVNSALFLPEEKIRKPDDVQKHINASLDHLIENVYGVPVEAAKKTAIEHTLLPPVDLNKLLEEGPSSSGFILAMILIQLSAQVLDLSGDEQTSGEGGGR